MMLILALSQLTACASSQNQLKTQTPANLTQPCADLAPVETSFTIADLLEWSIETTNQYAECRNKHKALSEAINGINAK
jgi:hypothetical protein